MKYYRIKKEHDNRRRLDGSILIGNELYTEKELNKYKIPEAYCNIVEISKKKVYFFFGARFSN